MSDDILERDGHFEGPWYVMPPFTTELMILTNDGLYVYRHDSTAKAEKP